jgi:hypothetical protein
MMVGMIPRLWDSGLEVGNMQRRRTCVSACSWPFSCVAYVSSDDKNVGMHVGDTEEVAGGRSGSISKREIGDGEKAAPDDEDDERCRDFARHRRLHDEEGRWMKSGVMWCLSHLINTNRMPQICTASGYEAQGDTGTEYEENRTCIA